MTLLRMWFMPPWVNPIYGIWLPLAAMLFAMAMQARVQSTFRRFAQIATRSGLTGAEVAELLLRSRGISDVQVEQVGGFLSDHYDPRTKTLRLSPPVFAGRSIAALGVAAHETGHALQHADAYAWLNLRSRMVPVVSIGSKLGMLGLVGTQGRPVSGQRIGRRQPSVRTTDSTHCSTFGSQRSPRIICASSPTVRPCTMGIGYCPTKELSPGSRTKPDT